MREKEVLNLKEACKHIGVCAEKLRKELKEHDIPHRDAGYSFRVRKSELEPLKEKFAY